MSESDPPPNFRPSFSNCDGVSDLCPVELSLYGSFLSQPGNAALLSVFSICALVQIGNAIYTRTRTYCKFHPCGLRLLQYEHKVSGAELRTAPHPKIPKLTIHPQPPAFTICLLSGTVCEILGYTGRVLLHSNPWSFAAFAMQMCCLIVGPAFIAAAMSVTFKHLITYTGPAHSLLKPRLYPWVFVGTDFASIVVQGMGGGIASAGSSDAGNSNGLLEVGDNLLLAGVAFQVANMLGCGVLMLVYVWRYKCAQRRGQEEKDADYAADRAEAGAVRRLRVFCWAIVVAYVAVLARCIYRLPEFASGWGSELQQNETTFLILDGAMIAMAVVVLTVVAPARWFPAMERYSRSKKTRTRQEAGRDGGDGVGVGEVDAEAGMGNEERDSGREKEKTGEKKARQVQGDEAVGS